MSKDCNKNKTRARSKSPAKEMEAVVRETGGNRIRCIPQNPGVSSRRAGSTEAERMRMVWGALALGDWISLFIYEVDTGGI